MESFTSTKAQVWSIDFFVAIVILVGALFIFYQQGLFELNRQQQDINDLVLDAKVVSNYLVSAGYPANWTESNVSLIGLTDGSLALDETKIDSFAALAAADYTTSKHLLSTSHNFEVFFEDRTNATLTIHGVSRIGADYSAADPDNVIRIVRFVSYNSEIIKMVLYVW